VQNAGGFPLAVPAWNARRSRPPPRGAQRAAEPYTARLQEVHVARIPGVEAQDANFFTRLIYWIAKRKLRQVAGRAQLVEPLTISAHHPRLLVAVAQMEAGQAAAHSVPAKLKSLASIQAALLIGCPY
jgi:hypothetical protein